MERIGPSTPPPPSQKADTTFDPSSSQLTNPMRALIKEFVEGLLPLSKEGRELNVILYIVTVMADLLVNKSPNQITNNPKMVNTIAACLDLLNKEAGNGTKGNWLDTNYPKIWQALNGFTTNTYVTTLRNDLDTLNHYDQNPGSATSSQIKALQDKIDKTDIPAVQKQAHANNSLWLMNLKMVESYTTGNFVGWAIKAKKLLTSVLSLISLSSTSVKMATDAEQGIDNRTA